MDQKKWIIVGNSIVGRLQVEGITSIVRPGKVLEQMREEMEWKAMKIVITGIPDIMAYKGADHVNGRKIEEYKKELEKVSRKGNVVLCPFYPTEALKHSQWGIVQNINRYICELNAQQQLGTPNIVAGLFGRERYNDRLYFKSEKLEDGVHPGEKLAEEMSRRKI